MEFARPPSYVPPSPSNPFHGMVQAQAQRGVVESLPAYSRPAHGHGRRRPHTAHGHSQRTRAPGAEHVIPLTVSDSTQANTRSWAELRFQSSAKSKSHTPLFHPGDEIVGCLELDLLKEKSIGGINISLRGYTVTDSQLDQGRMFPSPGYVNPATKSLIPFLDLKSLLWKPSMGDPRCVTPLPTIAGGSDPNLTSRKSKTTKDFKEKLLGSYSFPFSFILPHEVDNELLPPDVSDSHGKAPIQIKYEVEVKLQTALFKADAMILCPFHVIPHKIAPFPSPARELIYTCRPDSLDTRLVPPGPEEDRDGWKSLRPVRFDQTSCVMSLANPLVYVRGTPIHIHLRFSSGTAVDPSDLRIALVNTTQITNETGSRPQKRAGSPSTPAIRTCIVSAVCYRRPQDEDMGVVHAEIKVPKDLTPEFDFKGVHSEYRVLLFSSSVPSSSLAPGAILNSSTHSLVAASVKIATDPTYTPESRIVPLSFLPPHLASLAENRASPLSGSRPGSRAANSRGVGRDDDVLERLLTARAGDGWSHPSSNA